MSASTCARCGHEEKRHPRVGVKDRGQPVEWTTSCDDCEVGGGFCPEYVPGDEPVVEDLDVVDVVPLEDRLRTALVGAGVAGVVLAVLLLVGGFGLGVAARWAVDGRVAHALDGTALLCAAAAAVVGVLAGGAIRFGIGSVDEPVEVVEVDDDVSGGAS